MSNRTSWTRFIVQIQADTNERPEKKENIATDLCQDINRIRANYQGLLGGAQIMPKPKNIQITQMAALDVSLDPPLPKVKTETNRFPS